MFKAYTGERAWNSTGDRLKGLFYLNGDEDDRKVNARKQRILVCK
jgi:hypothetical protein